MGVPHSRDIKHRITEDNGYPVIEPLYRLPTGEWIPYSQKEEHLQRLANQHNELQQYRQYQQYQHQSYQFQQQVQLYLQQLQQLQMQRMPPVNNFFSPAPIVGNPVMYQPTPLYGGYSMPNQFYHPVGFFR